MFSNMRSQVKEKTGRDVPKFVPQKSSLSRTSRQGSESSLSSLILDPTTPQNSTSCPSPTGDLHQIKLLADGKVLSPKEVSQISKKEDEWRSRLEKKDTEWSKKFDKREGDLLRELSEKQSDWNSKERKLTEDLFKQTNELKDALKMAEELKRKVIEYQEEKDQVESFQTQEMSKIKHLLLAKERDNVELSSSLKETQSQVDSYRSEMSRLRPLEQKIADIEEELEMVRHAGEKEKQSLVLLLTESQEQVSHLSDRVALLAKRSSDSELASEHTPDNRIQALLGERTLLERRLEEAHIHLTDIKASWSAKISSLETQVGRLSRQAGEEGVERRRAEQRVHELDDNLKKQVEQVTQLTNSLSAVSKERDELTDTNQHITQLIEEMRMDKVRLESEVKRLEIETERLGSMETQLHATAREKEQLETAMSADREDLASMRNDLVECKRQLEDLVLRNAQLSQQADMAHSEASTLRQELEQALTSSSTLQTQLHAAQQEVSKAKEELAEMERETKNHIEASQRSTDSLQHVTASVTDLEARLAERNKTIRVLQQNLSDMKKTLRQRELKGEANHVGLVAPGSGVPANFASATSAAAPSVGAGSLLLDPSTVTPGTINDINFQYLKHVIVKFLTSREYEAQQLTKAVATLLQLTAEEELLIRDTLDWKMSWFRTRPRLQDYS